MQSHCLKLNLPNYFDELRREIIPENLLNRLLVTRDCCIESQKLLHALRNSFLPPESPRLRGAMPKKVEVTLMK